MWDGKSLFSIHHLDSRLVGPSLWSLGLRNVTGHIYAVEYWEADLTFIPKQQPLPHYRSLFALPALSQMTS